MSKNKADVSIVFRALNEEKFFEAALKSCVNQKLDGMSLEIILVDSGSTDRTLEIANKYDCKIVEITREMFSFGRSLNWGCEAASGEYLIFISAHCIPTHDEWLLNLLKPLRNGDAVYSYGKQVGGRETKFSENQLFAKYFGETDKLQDSDFFINNANSAIRTDVWREYKFDEEATGLEDMILGKKVIESGRRIAYASQAPVTHIHEENFGQVRNRYYREALTLREVLPDVRLSFFDFLRFVQAGIINDISAARDQKCLKENFVSILKFRLMQFWGSYKGQNENRKISRAQKESYYYPSVKKVKRNRNSAQRHQSIAQISSKL